MEYIIEDANVVTNQGILIRSYLIQDRKINHYSKSLKQYNRMKMNVSSYFMTPGHVMADLHLINHKNIADLKKQQFNLIKKGCTTVLLPYTIPYENDFAKRIRAARHAMINTTIDFVIGLRLPAEKLTPTMIRLCKRHQIPFIVADITEDTNIPTIPWGWIREAQFQFQIPIYPLWKIEEAKSLKWQKEIWNHVTNTNNIPTYLDFSTNYKPLPSVIRKQIGIYPRKGELLIGNELDYNLYQYPTKLKVEDSSHLDYDKVEPIITVHKGKIVKVENRLNFFPGYGQELIIKMPGLFASIDHYGNRPHQVQ